MNLKRINLNLLIHFNTIYESRSVSVAAKKSFVTQTAMSHILRQLRDLFDDPLFIRKSIGVRPTKKATELAPKIKKVIDSMQDVFKYEDFIPNQYKAHFNIAVTSYGEHLLLSKLCLYLKEHAPRVSVHITPLSTYENVETLLEEDIDLVIAPGFINMGEIKNICTESLITDKPVCIARKGRFEENFTVDDFMGAEHVNVRFSENAEKTLNENVELFGIRNVKFNVPNVISGMEIIENSDLIMTIPNSLANVLSKRFSFDVHPFPSEESFIVKAWFHRRMLNFTPLEWLIKVIIELTNAPTVIK